MARNRRKWPERGNYHREKIKNKRPEWAFLKKQRNVLERGRRQTGEKRKRKKRNIKIVKHELERDKAEDETFALVSYKR